MKKSILIALFISSATLVCSAQEIEDSSRRTLGYIWNTGTVENASRSTLGYIDKDGTVEDSSRRTLGYINKNGEVEDRSRRTLGYVSSSGEVEDRSRRTLGYINSEWRGRGQFAANSWLCKRYKNPTRCGIFLLFLSTEKIRIDLFKYAFAEDILTNILDRVV